MVSALMERTGPPLTNGGDPVDWDGLVSRLLHDTQILIIETLKWIDQPLSASELESVFYGTIGLSSVSYHVGRLAELCVLEKTGERPVRGATEHFYFFVGTDAD